MVVLYQIENLYKEYLMGKNTVKAINGVSLEFNEGKFYSLIGPSGSGKSTLLHLMGLLDTPNKGKVWLDGLDTSLLSDDRKATIRNKKIGFIFQQYHLIPVLNIYENIEIPFLQSSCFSKQEIVRRISRLIEETGLEDYKWHKPSELSGGQQQRVAIARALAMKPRVVLADEPTANLDSHTSKEIIKLLNNLNRQEGTTFIFSTHDPMVMDYCDKIIHIKDGMIIKGET
jgi:putative ABC transport system ATP-binding protein